MELGCGTGKLMTLLGKAGFDMIGVDNSVEMLQIAREKTSQDFLYLLQDMREFELYGTVKAVISVCDSVNYITKKEELRKVFQLVNNYLDPEGVFIFDFNTEYKYRELIGETVIAEESTAWPKVTDKAEYGGLDFSLKWNMGWMHDFLEYMKLDPYFRKYNHTKMNFAMVYAYSENYMLVLSHDEVAPVSYTHLRAHET